MSKLNACKILSHRCILFVSSYVPLYLFLILKDIISRLEEKKFNMEISYLRVNSLNDIVIIVLVAISAFSIIYLKKVLGRVQPSIYVKVGKVRDETSSNFLNYISVYFMSCIGLRIDNFTDLFTLSFLMIVIGFIYIRGNLIYINPILNLMGYNIYDLEGTIEVSGEVVEAMVIVKKDISINEGDLLFTTKKSSFMIVKKNENDEY